MDYKKLDKRIDDMLKYETDDFLVNIELADDVCNKLLIYQYLHVFNLITALRNNDVVLDGSDTGTGKTYTAMAVCKQLKLKPLIVCPKSIMSTWKSVAGIFGVKPLAIVNYETFKKGREYDKDGNRVESEYLKIDNSYKNEYKYRWTALPYKTLIIFDEVHRCRNKGSENAKLLMSTKGTKSKVMMISATISDTPSSFHVFGYVLGLYKTMRQSRNWVDGAIREDKSCISSTGPKLSLINQSIYPLKGSRMRVAELGDKFPKNQISVDCYNIDPKHKLIVNEAFKTIIAGEKIKQKVESEQQAKILADITKARQRLELIKVPIFEELVNEYRENGYNIAIFVNYTNTLNKLANKLKTTCTVHGMTTIPDREKNIKDFQSNKANIIICNIGIAEGISLHDIHGVPRVSLISPSFSSIEITQALGRICRAGAKTPALQRIIYCDGTVEEVICNRVREKLKFTSTLNDNDLISI